MGHPAFRLGVKFGGRTAGPSTALRSGRDDNSVVPEELQREILNPATEL
jgi:hypothetical protein